MNELEQKISNLLCNLNVTNDRMFFIKTFISKCSLSEFDVLKDLEYDLTQKDNE